MSTIPNDIAHDAPDDVEPIVRGDDITPVITENMAEMRERVGGSMSGIPDVIIDTIGPVQDVIPDVVPDVVQDSGGAPHEQEDREDRGRRPILSDGPPRCDQCPPRRPPDQPEYTMPKTRLGQEPDPPPSPPPAPPPSETPMEEPDDE